MTIASGAPMKAMMELAARCVQKNIVCWACTARYQRLRRAALVFQRQGSRAVLLRPIAGRTLPLIMQPCLLPERHRCASGGAGIGTGEAEEGGGRRKIGGNSWLLRL